MLAGASHKKRDEEMECVDVVIIGAGVAGLFAAYELISKDFPGTITILEQGLDVQKRLHLDSNAATRDALCGVGGPGLFIDGKICLAEDAGTKLPEFIDKSLLKEDVDYIEQIFKTIYDANDLERIRVKPPCADIAHLSLLDEKLAQADLRLGLAYPVLRLGSDHIRQIAARFEAQLTSHSRVRLLTQVTAQHIETEGDRIKVVFSDQRGDEHTFFGHSLISAVGKSGHDWLVDQLGQLGEERQGRIMLTPNTPDIGLRLEFPKAIIAPLMRLVQNPRIIMRWNNTYLKTHCWCHDGFVSTFEYLGVPFVLGETFAEKVSGYSSVNLLYHFKPAEGEDGVEQARRIAKAITQSNQGYPAVECLARMQNGRKACPPIKGSDISGAFQPAHFPFSFQEEILAGILTFIEHLDTICPGIADGSNLLYGPAIEWDTYRVPVDEYMRPILTSADGCAPLPNIYTVGDGAGLTQGVVAAATSGLIAARHILEDKESVSSTKQLEFAGLQS